MSGYATKHRLTNCGCGGKGILWVTPSEWDNERGHAKVFCNKHCGIKVGPRAFGPGRKLPTVTRHVARTWNKAMQGWGPLVRS
jgi:hypothetical protein